MTAKSHWRPQALCSCRNGQSPHTLISVSHSLSWCRRSLGNCHIYKSEYLVNMHRTWWLCVSGPRGWQPNNNKGLFLRGLQKVIKKPWSCQAWSYCAASSTWMTQQVKDLTAKCSQTLPFDSLLLSTAAVPFLQSLLHSSTPSQENAG